MMTVDLQGHGVVAVEFEMRSSNFQVDGWLKNSLPASEIGEESEPMGVVVEVLRRLGGVTPRALVGGVFHPDNGRALRTEVAYGVGAGSPWGECASSLWKRPLVAGLPLEFAQGVTRGLTSGERSLPAGRLRVEYAGYDPVESSAIVFAQAVGVLLSVVVAGVRGLDVDAEVREIINSW